MNSLTYTPGCGEDISNTAKTMLALAMESGKRVTATFNNAPLLADPDMSWQEVKATWDATKKILWRREAKRYAPEKRRQRKERRRTIAQAHEFVRAAYPREWGQDPVSDVRFLKGWLPCLGWTYVTDIVSEIRAEVKHAYPQTDFKAEGVETPELFAKWLLGNAVDMHFDGPTVHFFSVFEEKFPAPLPVAEGDVQ